MLTRAAILACDDLPREAVQVPEWGGEVFVRAMTGGERVQLERLSVKNEGAIDYATIVAMCTVDAAGDRLFTEKDIPALAAKHSGALVRIATAAMRFNLMTVEAMDAAGNV